MTLDLFITGITVTEIEDSPTDNEHWPDAHVVRNSEPPPQSPRTVAVGQHWTDRRGRHLVVLGIGFTEAFDPEADAALKVLVRNGKTGRRSKIKMGSLIGHRGYWPIPQRDHR